jgi:hypothetical protein
MPQEIPRKETGWPEKLEMLQHATPLREMLLQEMLLRGMLPLKMPPRETLLIRGEIFWQVQTMPRVSASTRSVPTMPPAWRSFIHPLTEGTGRGFWVECAQQPRA